MEKLELIFTYGKETKNTIRYQGELGEVAHSSRDIAVGTLYVQKEVLGELRLPLKRGRAISPGRSQWESGMVTSLRSYTPMPQRNTLMLISNTGE